MSTILEALKKSEKERKLNNLPTLSDMPPPQERTRWPVALLSILAVLVIGLLLVLAIRWWQPNQAQPAVRVVSNETIAATGAEPANEGRVEGEKIVVNVVSYSDDPAQRFAMINGKMVRENEFVRAGLKVEKIDPSSVLLNQRGERIRRTP